jgi:hypothetical protein
LRLTNSPQKAICIKKPSNRCWIYNLGKQLRKDYKEDVENDLQDLKQQITEETGDLLYNTLRFLKDWGAKESNHVTLPAVTHQHRLVLIINNIHKHTCVQLKI